MICTVGRSRRSCAAKVKQGSDPAESPMSTTSGMGSPVRTDHSLRSEKVQSTTEFTKPVCCKQARKKPEVAVSELATAADNIFASSLLAVHSFRGCQALLVFSSRLAGRVLSFRRSRREERLGKLRPGRRCLWGRRPHNPWRYQNQQFRFGFPEGPALKEFA